MGQEIGMKLLDSIITVFISVIIKGFLANVAKPLPIRRNHSSLAKSHIGILPSVARLFRKWNPLAVFRAVALINVNSFNAVPRFSKTHIFYKGHKAVFTQPFVTNSNAPTTVINIVRVISVITPRLHALVSGVFGHIFKPIVAAFYYLASIKPVTTAAFCPTANYVIYSRSPFITAGTPKKAYITRFAIFKKRIGVENFTSLSKSFSRHYLKNLIITGVL